MNVYAQKIRRELHRFPEVGFELPRTLALLRRELDGMGVEYTEEYGKSSLVATVNPEKSHLTLAVRADMDALPMKETCDVPYKSEIDGQMHACGHDAHTAIALATLREINEMRDKIACRVKFVFQAAEEFAPSGAKLMAEDGVMDSIDAIVALHVDASYNTGEIGICAGPQNATSDGFVLEFFGKSAHAANQEQGIDALMMAVRAYTDIQFMISKELNANASVIFNVGSMHGGEANNIICDYAYMYCTLRTFTDEVAAYIIGKIKKIIASIADSAGGSARFVEKKHYPIVHNSPAVAAALSDAAKKVVGEENVLPRQRSHGGEDFSFFASLKPGAMFRLGIKNKARGIISAVHHSDFDIDEDALEIGVSIFKQFILDNMNGISQES